MMCYVKMQYDKTRHAIHYDYILYTRLHHSMLQYGILLYVTTCCIRLLDSWLQCGILRSDTIRYVAVQYVMTKFIMI